ncbi:hypothetical protein FO440_22350 [Mucilaginibacter corticis]|uniref:Uncharacterized protein n=1 Tax=Mucilaginibacter corticis TaxID=2597670 RepID=A0A556M9K2_9SPHI|nr:hypothetical protein [Mucilaginibacter corticis]TSJ36572.1 hypothetical protein FO440_22350 [Mucilaginibacter corticis]
MALSAITAAEHERNLNKLSNVKMYQSRIEIEKELEGLLAAYHDQLMGLGDTIEQYKSTAAKIPGVRRAERGKIV